jgi:hypothetical protein
MLKIGHVFVGVVLALGLVALANTAKADGQMGNHPWGFKQQNRAGLAAMMVQKKSGALDGSSGGGTVAAGNSCGGSGGTSSATANYTCIILGDGAIADIEALQDALGDQTATSETQATANGVPDESLSEVLEALTN